MKTVLIIIVTLLTLSACSIEKRMHTKGWNVQWNRSLPISNNQQTSNEFQKISSEQENEDLDISQTDTVQSLPLVKKSLSEKDSLQNNTTQTEQQIQKETVRKISTSFVSESFTSQSFSVKKVLDKKEMTQKSGLKKRDIDWELIGTIALIAFLLLLGGLALFGTGTIATIASIILLLGQLALTIAAVVAICWFFWFILFGWWMR